MNVIPVFFLYKSRYVPRIQMWEMKARVEAWMGEGKRELLG